MYQFDLLSDIHLDKWFHTCLKDIEKEMKSWIEKILPSCPSDVLVFAGDFGEYNAQNVLFLNMIKDYYKFVLFVLGNNDITLPRNDRNIEGFKSAKERLDSFLTTVDSYPNVHFLDGNTITHENVTFGGCSLFFDFELLKKHFRFTEEDVHSLWLTKKMTFKHSGIMDDVVSYIQMEKKKLKSVLPKSHIIVTHGPPDYFFTPNKKNIGFYAFVGDEYISLIQNKLWCYGHIHSPSKHLKYGCQFINAASGKLTSHTKICQIKLKTSLI